MVGPSYRQIAEKAGVGTATVERVLNGRGGVRPDTTQRVIRAARALDYPGRLPEIHRGLIRIEVLMVRPETTFYRRLSHAFARIAATLDPLLVLHRSFANEMDSRQIVDRVNELAATRSGVILALPTSPGVASAVNEAASRGLPIIHVVTRASDTVGEFVGIDNQAAGRSAAMYIDRMAARQGPVVALCHPIYQVHRDRLRGFSDYFAHKAQRLAFDFVAFGNDEERRSAEMLEQALHLHPDLAGFYNAGGANSALIDVLRRNRRGKDIYFVGHELTPYTTAALRDGIMDVVLDQSPEAQARRSIDLMLHRLGLTEIEPDPSPIRFVTITAESL